MRRRVLTRRNLLLGAGAFLGATAAGVVAAELGDRSAGLEASLATPGQTASPSSTASVSASGSSLVPGQVLDLSRWKLSVPTMPGPTQIIQPQLSSYADPYFQVVSASVQFTAPVGGSVQDGSKYPRSELREQNPDGSGAAWSTTEGRHVLDLVQRITHLPVVKPDLVAGQIHDADEFVILVWLDGAALSVRSIGGTVGILDRAYLLGTDFSLRIEASGGYIDVYYNGQRKVHLADDRSGCYFKAGCYVQSSPGTGDSATAFGQVEISRLAVVHT